MEAVARSAIDHLKVVAIDGPAAAGKSTVARLLADRLDALLFDTGALYRAVTLAALRSGELPEDPAAVAHIARGVDIRILSPSRRDGRLYDVWLDGKDVTWELRTREIGEVVSQVAEHYSVREALLPVQRQIASGGPVVMVGRDIGTVVVPDAGLKIYLDAAPVVRAERRFREAAARGGAESLAEVMRETRHRDSLDSCRQTAPLRVADDAVRIDTDDLSINEVVTGIEQIARQRLTPTGEHIWPRRAPSAKM